MARCRFVAGRSCRQSILARSSETVGLLSLVLTALCNRWRNSNQPSRSNEGCICAIISFASCLQAQPPGINFFHHSNHSGLASSCCHSTRHARRPWLVGEYRFEFGGTDKPLPLKNVLSGSNETRLILVFMLHQHALIVTVGAEKQVVALLVPVH